MIDEENGRIDIELQDRERAAELRALADREVASLDFDRRLQGCTAWSDQDLDTFETAYAAARCFARPTCHLRLVKGNRT